MSVRRLAAGAAAGWIALAAVSTSAPAQLPHLDALPWYAPADSTSRLALVAQVDRCIDKATDWSANRVMLTVTLPAGQRAAWFLRMPYLSFDTAGLSVPARWPGTVGADQPAGWPHGERLEGFGQIEAGATANLRLPLLGPSALGFALGLPTGQNGLYPWSSTSMPLRLQARHDVLPGGDTHLWLGAGWLLHMDASGDALGPEAFPEGWQLDAALAVVRGRGSSWRLDAAWQQRQGRTSLLLGAELQLPWTADASFGLRAARELADAADRPAQWYLSFVWRFDSPAGRRLPDPARS